NAATTRARPDCRTHRVRPERRRSSRAKSNCSSVAQRFSCFFKIGRSVDAERDLVNARHRNTHARFKRSKLFELLALFERRWRQSDEAGERCPLERIDADMMVERAIA